MRRIRRLPDLRHRGAIGAMCVLVLALAACHGPTGEVSTSPSPEVSAPGVASEAPSASTGDESPTLSTAPSPTDDPTTAPAPSATPPSTTPQPRPSDEPTRSPSAHPTAPIATPGPSSQTPGPTASSCIWQPPSVSYPISSYRLPPSENPPTFYFGYPAAACLPPATYVIIATDPGLTSVVVEATLDSWYGTQPWLSPEALSWGDGCVTYYWAVYAVREDGSSETFGFRSLDACST